MTVKIDTRPPYFAWTSVSPGVIRRVEPVTLRFTVDGSRRSGEAVVQGPRPVRVPRGQQDRPGARPPGARSVALTPRYPNHKGFVPGLYRVQLTVT